MKTESILNISDFYPNQESLDPQSETTKYSIVQGGLSTNDFNELQKLLISTNEHIDKYFKRNSILQYKIYPRYFNTAECIQYLGKRAVFDILRDEYGLKSIRDKHKGNIYSTKHLEELCILFEKNLF